MTAGLLVGLVAYGAVAFGWRSYRQWRRTGSAGFRGLSGAFGSPEWLGGVLFVVAMGGTALALAGDLLGLAPVVADIGALRWVGCALFVLGFTATIVSQVQMGDAWRIGVSESERTALVHRGLFRVVRNPIFASMWLAVAGVALAVPNWFGVGALVTLTAALELQVRLVEEPYLLRAHGDGYLAYTRRTGRFVPWLGRRSAQAHSRAA